MIQLYRPLDYKFMDDRRLNQTISQTILDLAVSLVS